ncbi:MAG: hypothetical protein JRH01_06780, partial [Deltaproteobacteria bacterium]|nr:hypothetical protein [Deltaproteobacteria bacterium]
MNRGWIALTIGLCVVAILCFVVWSRINGIAQGLIGHGSTMALGVETSLDSVAIDVFTGSFVLADLEVANPEGFSAPQFLGIGEA